MSLVGFELLPRAIEHQQVSECKKDRKGMFSGGTGWVGRAAVHPEAAGEVTGVDSVPGRSWLVRRAL